MADPTFPFPVFERKRGEKGVFKRDSDNKLTMQRTFSVPWENRFVFAMGMITRSYPELPFCICTDFAIEGEAMTGRNALDALEYEDAVVTLSYESMDVEPIPENPSEEPEDPFGRNVSIELDFASQDVRMPDTAFAFPDGQPLLYSAKRMGVGVMRITVDDLPKLDRKQLMDLTGKISTGSVLGFPGDQVLFDGAKARRSFSNPVPQVSGGSAVIEAKVGWSLTVEYLIRSESWNLFPHPETGEFQEVRSTEGNRLFYESANIVAPIESFVKGLNKVD